MDYRPCYIKKHKALFHKWEDKAWVVAESPVVGGTPAGQMRMTIGIVEYDDGTVHECYPDEIRFCDNPHKGYDFDSTSEYNAHENMQFIIEHSDTKREIQGAFNICGSKENFKYLRDCIDKGLEDGLAYGWINILGTQKSIMNAEPIDWE